MNYLDFNILYRRDIVLDIIFNDILGYEDYKYEHSCNS